MKLQLLVYGFETVGSVYTSASSAGFLSSLCILLILAAALMRVIQMAYTKKLTKDQEFDSAVLTLLQMAMVTVLAGCVALIEPRWSTEIPSSDGLRLAADT